MGLRQLRSVVRLAVAAAVGATLVAMTGCSGSPDLDLLDGLDVSHVTIDEAERIDVDRVSGRDGSAFAKPRAAEIRQRYQPRPGVTVSEAFEALSTEVAAHGWELTEGSEPEFVTGEREVEGRQVELMLYVPTYADDLVLLRLVAR